MATIPFSSVDLKNLSEAELEIVVQVIQKDFELKAAEKARLRRHRRQLKDYDKRVSILASSNFNERFCVICFQRFFFLIVPKRCCYSCRHSMCSDCSVWIPVLKAYICLLCQKERNLKSMGCDWYYGLLKNKFQQDGSEIVAQSLYNNQGQWYIQLADSIITPDLLRKVKGAQISRYRQKIHSRWEEMQERLQQIDQSDIMKNKKDEAWHYLIEEYKNHFRDILKEFSQFLYITLENYASKVDDPNLNINEQVITTVYDEVELMIGYRINYMPEEMGSILSDVESTTSLFIGNQMEEKLASALVNKIIQDHSLNELQTYDDKDMPDLFQFHDPLQHDDDSSTASYLYQTGPFKTGIANGNISGRSSTVASSFLDTEPSVEMNKNQFMQYSNPLRMHHNNDSESTLEDMNDPSDVMLSIKELKNILRYSSSDRRSLKYLIERTINVPYGEPIKLQLQLNGISDIETTWSLTNTNRTVILYNTDDTEITESIETDSITFHLKKWQTTGSDAGIYTALISNQTIVEFRVNIIVNNKKPVRPTFRLKMLNCSCRTSQVGEFSVEPLGYPEPRITFYHKNKLISTQNDKYKIEYKEQISRYILKILNVTDNDHGTYKCVAINASGFCECNAQLQVTNVKFRFDNQIPRSNSSNSSVEDDIFRFPPTQNNRKPDSMDNQSNITGGPLNETSRDHMKSPSSYKSQVTIKENPSPNSMKSPSNVRDYSTPNTTKSPSKVKDYSTPSTMKNPSNVKDYPSPNTTKSPSNVKDYSTPNTTKSPSKVKDYSTPNTMKTPSNIRDNPTSNPVKTPSSVKENPPRHSWKNPDSNKSVALPDTVIGREIPDEFTIRSKQDSGRMPRPIHSYSTENLDSMDSPSKISRNEAMKSSRYSLSGSNSNISKLKLLFEQPEFPTVQRNSSITGRTPRPDSRRSQSPFTKEVRVTNYEYTN